MRTESFQLDTDGLRFIRAAGVISTCRPSFHRNYMSLTDIVNGKIQKNAEGRGNFLAEHAHFRDKCSAMPPVEDLLELARQLTAESEKIKHLDLSGPLGALQDVANQVAKAASGSWLGYQSRIYYKDLQPVPPGARFSQEWGSRETWSFQETIGEWMECSYESVVAYIRQRAGSPNLAFLEEQRGLAADTFESAKTEILSHISHACGQNSSDTFLSSLKESIENLHLFNARQVVDACAPRGQHFTRDMTAMQEGLRNPPHIGVIADVAAIRCPFDCCEKLAKLAKQTGSHLSRVVKKSQRDERIGTNAFIGHGRSKVWRDLKDFLQDRVRLPWDEFNRVPVAGVTNIARLSQMLDAAAIAFLILTAEDEQADGKMQARMNVIHEAGLFQGRLGFQRAIVLLEDGCEEFSNIQGLGQIRFPAGNIPAIFEEIRRVLEREGLTDEKA